MDLTLLFPSRIKALNIVELNDKILRIQGMPMNIAYT